MKQFSFPRFPTLALHLFVAALSLWLAVPAFALSTGWAETKGGRMRLVALPARPDGTLPAILQIEPEKGWKTYWREPGSSGIPPQMTLADGGNVIYSGLRFPVPTVFAEGATRDYGYDQPVSLVLSLKQLTKNMPSRLDATVFIGLCEKICVPFQASFTLDIPASAPGNSADTGLIAQAEMALPEPPSDDFRVETTTLSDDGKGLALTLLLPEAAPSPDLLITSSDGLPFGPASDVRREGNRLTARFHLAAAPPGYRLKPGTVMLLVESGDRAMETTLAFE